MPAPIPDATKSKVIELWLLGHSRDFIASANNISTGGVYNIVKEWEDAIGRNVARGLREMAVLLKKEGLSPAQCAIGLRIMKIFENQGVDAEAAEHFVSDMYQECNKHGITPSNIIAHIEDLVKFSNEEKVRLPEIQSFIDRKIIQKKELEDSVVQLNNTVANLTVKESELEKNNDTISEQIKRAGDEMKSYYNSKQELENHGISMANDVSKFASTVKAIAKYGYDPQRVLDEFLSIRYHQDKFRALKISCDEKQKELAGLDSQKSLLLKSIGLHSRKADVYNELENAGFGVEQLKRLLDTIINIASLNQISQWIAIGKFFNDIDTQYGAILGFENAKDKLITEIKVLEEKKEKEMENLKNQPLTSHIITGLLRTGLNETDIVQWGKIFLDISKSSYSIKDIAVGMIEAVEKMTSNRVKSMSDEETIEILRKAKEEFSRVDSF